MLQNIYTWVGILFVLGVSIALIAYGCHAIYEMWIDRNTNRLRGFLTKVCDDIDGHCEGEFPQASITAQEIRKLISVESYGWSGGDWFRRYMRDKTNTN